jgi:hypothetical protein
VWGDVKVLHLQQNMQVRDTHDSHLFAQWLLDIGHGQSTSDENTSTSITIPQMMRSTSENDLIQQVYRDMINQPYIPPTDFFHDRAILAPRNDNIRRLNNTILYSLSGEEQTYTSADSYTIDSPDIIINQNIPVEFLQSQCIQLTHHSSSQSRCIQLTHHPSSYQTRMSCYLTP